MVIVFIRFWKDVIQPLRPFCRDCIWHRHLPLLSSSQHWLHGQCSSELKAHEMSGPGVLVPVLCSSPLGCRDLAGTVQTLASLVKLHSCLPLLTECFVLG